MASHTPLNIRGITEFFQSQPRFYPIPEVGPRSVEMWITALNLGVTHSQVARTAPKVLELLRAEAQPPVTKKECQEYQLGADSNTVKAA
jgi:hypothetical protein